MIDFLRGSGAEGAMTFSRKELDRFIAFLGEARALMNDPQGAPDLAKLALRVSLDPRWWVALNKEEDATVFTVEHAELGPLRFTVPRIELAKLVSALTIHLEKMQGAMSGAGGVGE